MAPEQAAGRKGADHGRRRVRPRRDPLRAADRPAAVHAATLPGHAAPAGPREPARRRRSSLVSGRAPRPGDDLPEVPGEGARTALRLGRGPGRRPRPLAARRADPGPAGRAGRAGLAVVRRNPVVAGLTGRGWPRRWSWGPSSPRRSPSRPGQPRGGRIGSPSSPGRTTGKAIEAARRAGAEKDWSDRLRYVAEINAAQREFEAGDVGSARKRLAELAPRAGASRDPRGFELALPELACSTRQLTLLVGHPDAVSAWRSAPTAAASPRRAHDKTVRLWDTVTGRGTAGLRGHSQVDLLPGVQPRRPPRRNGEPTIGRPGCGTAETGGEIAVMRGHGSTVNGVAFSPDGHRLATGSDDRAVRSGTRRPAASLPCSATSTSSGPSAPMADASPPPRTGPGRFASTTPRRAAEVVRIRHGYESIGRGLQPRRPADRDGGL